jgi:hypothetical protein
VVATHAARNGLEVMPTEVLSTDVPIEVPESIKNSTGVASFAITNAGKGTVTGTDGTTKATFTVATEGKAKSLTFTRTGGKPVTVVCTASQAANGNLTAEGTIDGSPYNVTVTKDGQLVNGEQPKNLDPNDLKIFEAVSKSFVVHKFELPTKPSPFIPKDTDGRKIEDRMVAQTTNKGGPIVDPTDPLFHRAGCALGLAETVFGLLFFQPEAIAWGVAGLIVSCPG